MRKGERTLSRRGALVLLGTGTALMGSGTMGFTHLSSDRESTIDVAADEDAAIGLIPGASSLLVSNNLTAPATVTVSPNDTSTVLGDTTITLDPRTDGEPDTGTHTFLFDPADVTTDFDVTVTVTADGMQVQTIQTITPANDPPADNAVELLIEEAADNVHTWNVASAGAGAVTAVDEIDVDYSGLNETNTATFLDTVRPRDVAVSVVDTGGNNQNIRVDRSQLNPGDISGNFLTIPLRDTFNFDNADTNRLVVTLGRVAAVDGSESGTASLTVRSTSNGTSTTVTVDFTTGDVVFT